MDLIRSLAIAFSMYSRVPVPQVEWSERSMKYTFLFFPAVGLLEGALLLGIGRLLRLGGIAPLLRGAFLTLFLFVYTGGIHMDGFMDTMDALGSARPREEKLRILKDPHTGSFAVLSCVLCCILVFTSFAGLDSEAALRVPACGMVLSRALSALFLITVPGKTRKGSAKMFADAASRMVTIIALFFWGSAGRGGDRFSLVRGHRDPGIRRPDRGHRGLVSHDPGGRDPLYFLHFQRREFIMYLYSRIVISVLSEVKQQ